MISIRRFYEEYPRGVALLGVAAGDGLAQLEAFRERSFTCDLLASVGRVVCIQGLFLLLLLWRLPNVRASGQMLIKSGVCLLVGGLVLLIMRRSPNLVQTHLDLLMYAAIQGLVCTVAMAITYWWAERQAVQNDDL